MYCLSAILFLLMLTSKLFCYADGNLSSHLQLMAVTSNDWESNQGTLHRFERLNEDDEWHQAAPSFSVVLGSNGMAWGTGIYPLSDDTAPLKVEGDLKSPAGIFSLGCAFGFLPAIEMPHLKMDYLQLTEFTEAVDDPSSMYYNRIVDTRKEIVDWNSSEKMRDVPLYEIGLIVNHNFPDPIPGNGSAIFFHLWRDSNSGTAGCTAMSHKDLYQILAWLDSSKKPVLVQLPCATYALWQKQWDLPPLTEEDPKGGVCGVIPSKEKY